MSTINIQNIRDELCQFFRANDVLSTSVRGITRTSSSYTVGVSGESTHTFTGNIPVRDFNTLTVDGTAKYWLRDYTINWTTGVLTWNTPLVNGQVVVYKVDWGSGDKIYPDLPRDDITLTSFPRIGITMTSISTTPFGIGGTTHISDMLFTIHILVPANKDTSIVNYGGLADLEETMRLIRDVIRTNAKNFYTFSWITPIGVGPLLRGTNNKILEQSADFMIRFKTE